LHSFTKAILDRGAEAFYGRAMSIVPLYGPSVLRFPLGFRVGALGERPVKQLELYEYEGCPFCRKVREALSMLDLEVLVKPCPRGGERFRREAIRLGGKAQFPLLLDPNTGDTLYESDTIVKHLYAKYGAGPAPLGLRAGPLGDGISALASLSRGGRGSRARPSRAPEAPLELWSFEISPYARRVREVLCELEIPYVLHNIAKKSPNRPALRDRAGKVQVPYIEDSNTGEKMFESADIVAYLQRTYGGGH